MKRRNSFFLILVVAFVLNSCVSLQAASGTVVQKQQGNRYQISYVIQKGDTLAKIAKRYGVAMEDIQRENAIYDPQDIFVGLEIIILKQNKVKRKKITKQEHKSLKNKANFIFPVEGRVTSPFGKRWGHMHTGVDFSSNKGREIKAAADGVVVFAGNRGGYGRAIIIQHTKRIKTLYGHNEKIYVHKGQRVKQGQVISYMGKTGIATGVHLHFEVRIDNVPHDPFLYLPSRVAH